MIARPFQQSDLDGLCGLHAVINACRYLAPHKVTVAGDRAQALAHRLADFMMPASFVEAWKNGTEKPDIMAWLGLSAAWLADGSPVPALQVREPEGLESVSSHVQFWAWLAGEIGDQWNGAACAIVGFGEPSPHWTVITGVTATSVTHYDSAGDQRTRISRTCIGTPKARGIWEVEPASTIILRRMA